MLQTASKPELEDVPQAIQRRKGVYHKGVFMKGIFHGDLQNLKWDQIKTKHMTKQRLYELNLHKLGKVMYVAGYLYDLKRTCKAN